MAVPKRRTSKRKKRARNTHKTAPAIVIADRADYDFACDFVRRHDLGRRVNAVLFSPAFRKDASGARDSSHCLLDPQQLAEWMLADQVPARLSLQIHKFIWDPVTKGV